MRDDMERASTFDLLEASIADLRAALAAGTLTCVELCARYLARIAFYDRHGIALNAVPVLNPGLFEEAAASDRRRRAGALLSPLDGIPYLVKASYAVHGLPVSSGSPAFEHLVAREDAFVVARLRAAGAIAIGITNMPPMAAGGMQRGLYGRAESPYNEHYLTAAFASGSSNGSGTGLAANFAAFALAEETWSSGRAPASNNALVAYTPSRGLISVRGNWPLVPTMDVVVPYARSLEDLFEILNVIVADDPRPRGDFWRMQQAVELPRASGVRPADYAALADAQALAGKRFGVPRMYVNADCECARPIATRLSVMARWADARTTLEAQGATVIEVDFPLVSNDERDRPGAASMVDRGLAPKGFPRAEWHDLIVHAWDDFLAAIGDRTLPGLAAVDGRRIFPRAPGELADRYGDVPDFGDYADAARAGVTPLADIPDLAAGLRGLEQVRKIDLEDWLDRQQLDGLVFPAVADVAPADADYNPQSADLAWRNGTWVANGNQALRHYGVPTVTVPMGLMADIGMPVGLTFAGRGYDDSALLRYAYAFEQATRARRPPPRTPALAGDVFAARAGDTDPHAGGTNAPPAPHIAAALEPMADDGTVTVRIDGTLAQADDDATLLVQVNGRDVPCTRAGARFSARCALPWQTHTRRHSHWRGPYGSIVTALVRNADGRCAAAWTVVGGIA